MLGKVGQGLIALEKRTGKSQEDVESNLVGRFLFHHAQEEVGDCGEGSRKILQKAAKADRMAWSQPGLSRPLHYRGDMFSKLTNLVVIIQ